MNVFTESTFCLEQIKMAFYYYGFNSDGFIILSNRDIVFAEFMSFLKIILKFLKYI